jgi:hypothetical protein
MEKKSADDPGKNNSALRNLLVEKCGGHRNIGRIFASEK